MMGQRYGRGQKRRHRAEIAELTGRLSRAEREAALFRAQVCNAKSEGATELLKLRYLDEVVERIASELARAYGPEIASAAMKLIASDQRRSSPAVADLSARIDDFDIQVMKIEGRIPEIRYCMMVSKF